MPMIIVLQLQDRVLQSVMKNEANIFKQYKESFNSQIKYE